MRSVLLLSLLSLLLFASSSFAQAAAQPAPGAARRAQPAAGRASMALTVTDARGGRLSGVHVEVIGASDRIGDTNASGQIGFTGMRPGTYRIRFSGDAVITYERDITVRNGQIASVDITLHAASPRLTSDAALAPAHVAAAAVVGPAGKPQTLPIVDVIEDDLIGNKEPRRDTLLACSGNTRTTLVQLNQDQPERLYDAAEVTYYVIAGEGAVQLVGRESVLGASSFVSVPRGTAHSLIRRGRRPLIVLATVSGAPCEQPR